MKGTDIRDWDEIKVDFEKAYNMSCKPDFKRFPNGYILDENQSVRWNKEQVEKNRSEYEKEVMRLRKEKNVAICEVDREIIEAIKSEVNYPVDDKGAEAIWNHAYDRGRSYGFNEILTELETIIDLINTVTRNTAKC